MFLCCQLKDISNKAVKPRPRLRTSKIGHKLAIAIAARKAHQLSRQRSAEKALGDRQGQLKLQRTPKTSGMCSMGCTRDSPSLLSRWRYSYNFSKHQLRGNKVFEQRQERFLSCYGCSKVSLSVNSRNSAQPFGSNGVRLIIIIIIIKQLAILRGSISLQL